MATLRTDHYSDLSADYLRKARAHFDEGDLTQASEKGWGATALALKACAESREWPHHRHWHHRGNLKRLQEETGETLLWELFPYAETMHANFYENWMDRDELEFHLERVEGLVPLLVAFR